MVLQAGQDGEIPLIHHATAQALDIAGTGLLLFRRTAALLLSHCTGGNRHRQDAECEEKLMHFVPSFLTAENPLSSPWWAEPERSPFVADATDRDDRRSKALVNAAKFAAARPRIAILAQQLNRGPQLFENTALFFTFLCS